MRGERRSRRFERSLSAAMTLPADKRFIDEISQEYAMNTTSSRPTIRRVSAAVVVATAMVLSVAPPRAQSVGTKETALMVQRALVRLPYYGVFDFLAFGVDRGVVSVEGFAYRASLKSDALSAIKRVAGVDEVANKIEVLPASQQDDRIRWSTFYNIYTDDFLSRYTPGGAMSARYEALSFARFQGMQPFGMYPIHIIVKNGRTMLFGVVDSELDKNLAGVRARDVTGVFGVENDLVVDKK
jgi:osmotically-inducible protein OsmY